MAAVMPASPPPITSAPLLTPMLFLYSGTLSFTLATAARTRPHALAVAFSGSFWCTHEQCSRMLANSNRYGLMPALSSVFWNRGSCVRGVQAATTSLLSLCCSIAALIAFCESCAHENISSPANLTPGSDVAYFTTDGTSTTEAMLMPQRHTYTPILGGSPRRSFCAGMSAFISFTERPPIAEAAAEAAPLASITDSGMSLGPLTLPHTNTPGLLVETGSISPMRTNPDPSSATERPFAVVIEAGDGWMPTESTRRSKRAEAVLPSCVMYRMSRSLVAGLLSTDAILPFMKVVPCRSFALSTNRSNPLP